MYSPTKMRENFVKNCKTALPQGKLTAPLVAFLGASQLIFGFNYGLAESIGKFKISILFITTAAGCMMIFTLILSLVHLDTNGSYFFVVYFVQYVPFFVILLKSKYTLCSFLSDIIGENEAESRKDKLGIFLWLYTSLMIFAKIATAIIFCLLTICSDSFSVMIDIAVHIPMIALDNIPIANFIIFYHVYARMRDLRIKYEYREISLKQLLTSYTEVANYFETFRFNYDAIFVWGFLTESGKWMVIIWKHLNLTKSSTSWWLYGCSYTWASFITIQICVPAVFAEMISVQTDAMKRNLHDKLLNETDEGNIVDLNRVLRYISARPLLNKAWRLVPLNLQLPITLLSICTTYLIVIIQFTHLYD